MKEKITEQIAAWENIQREQNDFYHRAAQWAGLPDAAHWVLYRTYSAKEPIIQSDLCKEDFFSKQTVNSAVAKLNTMGYLNAVLKNGNGNRKQLELTKEGRLFCEQYITPVIHAEQSSFEALTEEERETLLFLMRKQLTAMKQEAEGLWQ